jgi:hypothetical protein
MPLQPVLIHRTIKAEITHQDLRDTPYGTRPRRAERPGPPSAAI